MNDEEYATKVVIDFVRGQLEPYYDDLEVNDVDTIEFGSNLEVWIDINSKKDSMYKHLCFSVNGCDYEYNEDTDEFDNYSHEKLCICYENIEGVTNEHEICANDSSVKYFWIIFMDWPTTKKVTNG
jgi:hypothetical protein